MFKKIKQKRLQKKQREEYFSQVDLNILNKNINQINKNVVDSNNLLLKSKANAILYLTETINDVFKHNIDLSNLSEKEKIRIENEYSLNSINLLNFLKSQVLREQLRNDIDILIAQADKIYNNIIKHLFSFKKMSIDRHPDTQEISQYLLENIHKVTENNVFVNKFSDSILLNVFTTNKLFETNKDSFVKSLPNIIMVFLDFINDIKHFLLRYKTSILDDNFSIESFKNIFLSIEHDLQLLWKISNGNFEIKDSNYDFVNNNIIINIESFLPSYKMIEEELKENISIIKDYMLKT